MAQCLPFITYKTGEVADQIAKELPEFIMQTFDADEWSLRINSLLQKDRHLLQQELENIFEKHYSPETYYKQCISIYMKGLGKAL